jgi:hypothetical protein
MTDHHDFGDHHDDYQGGEHHQHDEPLGFDEPSQFDDDPGHYDDDPGHLPGDHYPVADHHDAAEPEHHEVAPTADDLHVADEHPHDNAATITDEHPDPADVFPPSVDLGDLPEPVDGFPWIDTAALGTPDGAGHDFPPVDPHELAEYAGTELPEGADPWTVLADSDDPATSTLARFFHDTTE